MEDTITIVANCNPNLYLVEFDYNETGYAIKTRLLPIIAFSIESNDNQDGTEFYYYPISMSQLNSTNDSYTTYDKATDYWDHREGLGMGYGLESLIEFHNKEIGLA